MKKSYLFFILLLLATGAGAQTTPVKPPVTAAKEKVDSLKPPPGDAKPGEFYGKKPEMERTGDINWVLDNLAGGTVNKDARFTATITDVCLRDGCWQKLSIADGGRAVVTLVDSTHLPLAAKGRTVFIAGSIERRTVPVEELKAAAKHLKKTKEEIEAIKQTEKEVKILATGMQVIK